MNMAIEFGIDWFAAMPRDKGGIGMSNTKNSTGKDWKQEKINKAILITAKQSNLSLLVGSECKCWVIHGDYRHVAVAVCLAYPACHACYSESEHELGCRPSKGYHSTRSNAP